MDRVSLHVGAGVVFADAGQLPRRHPAERIVGRPKRLAFRRENGKRILSAEIGAQRVKAPPRERGIGDKPVPVRDVIDSIDTGVPQPVNADRHCGKRYGKQEEGFREKRGQAALFTLQFCTRAREW